jgi:2-succinyl-6-hydroxy-2,4-cyclohexadiene-1-carboxylate synthase
MKNIRVVCGDYDFYVQIFGADSAPEGDFESEVTALPQVTPQNENADPSLDKLAAIRESFSTTSAVPILCLHGFTGSASSWAGAATKWSAQRPVVTVDLPGHGSTRCPRKESYAFEEQIEALLALAGKLFGNTPAHLAGYSMGGRLALGMAARAPQRWKSVLLESAHPGLSTEVERTERKAQDAVWIDLLKRSGIATFARCWEAQPLFHHNLDYTTRENREASRKVRLGQDADLLAAALAGAGLAEQPDFRPALARLAMPVLLVAGVLDRKFTSLAQEMAALLPKGELAIVRGAGHVVHAEQPERFAKLVNAFFAQHEYAAASVSERPVQLPIFS